MRSHVHAVSAAAILFAAISLAPEPVFAQEPRISVSLELSQQFFYEGDALNARVSVRNPGPTKLDNPIGADFLKGFRARRVDGSALEARADLAVDRAERPRKIAPRSDYAAVANLVEIFPDLSNVGKYQIFWSGDGVLSNMLAITVIPKYDPDKRYIARIETDLGPMDMVFFQDQSPLAAKTFVDLARSGFYDGLQFHEVHASSFIVGGDPAFGNPPRGGITFPAERTTVPLVAGTVLLKPVSPSPPANGPAFIILLKPRPAWSGQVTALGQVVRGLERRPAGFGKAQLDADLDTGAQTPAGSADPQSHDPRRPGGAVQVSETSTK